MATHSSVLAWRIPWTEEPGRSQKESNTTEQLTYTHTTHTTWSVVSPWSRKESDTTEQHTHTTHTLTTWLCLILGTGAVNSYVTVP